MIREQLDQFRRSQIYTPPPADYELEEPEPHRFTFPVGWLVYGALLFLAGFCAGGWWRV